MGRSCRCVVLLLAVLSFFAFSATALADDPEPLTVSASSTRETCTIGSVTTLDYNIVGGVPPYQVTVDGREIEQHSEPNYIPCRTSEFWWPLEELGDGNTQHIVVRVSDGIGARAHAIAKFRLVPALPAPTYLQVTSGVLGTSEANLSAVWRVPYLPGDQRTEDFAVRWRVLGTREWSVEHRRGAERPVFSFRDTWKIDAPPTGERREVQIAQLRHVHDLQAPEALAWSATAMVTTAAPPQALQAEATHDAITLSWGPHAAGLAYVATLRAVQLGTYEAGKRLRVTSGPSFQARFEDLLPDTSYRVSVYLDEEDGWGYRLDQHSFEIRTEPAPEDWPALSRLATDIQASRSGRQIEVNWTPPDTGSRHESRVCATPSDYKNFWTWTCTTVAPGESRASLPPGPYSSGGSYQIRVSTLTAPTASVTKRIHLPSYQPDMPTKGLPPAAARFTHVSWFHHPENPAPGTWKFKIEAAEGGRAEVLWRIQDQWFYREHRIRADDEQQVIIYTKSRERPEAVRYRVLSDGYWTPWSIPADTVDATLSVYITAVDEYLDHIQVHWKPWQEGSDVFGYRLYLTRNQGQEESIDLGTGTSARIPIQQGDASYTFRVAALTEGQREFVVSSIRRHERLPVALYLGQSGSWCQPEPGDRARVNWTISGGAAPFIISFDDQLGFETEVRKGWTVVECDLYESRSAAIVKASVLDASGQTAHDTSDISKTLDHWVVEDDPDYDPLQIYFRLRSVHRDRVLISWACNQWNYQAAMRWRVAGAASWTYASEFAHSSDGDRVCRGALDDLQPLTAYEYQLARVDPHEEVRRPEQLQWSATQTVTTLGEPVKPRIEREGETVAVSWDRQPEAWAYVVGLRAEGRMWWKRYEPSGEARETVYFYRIPDGLSLSFELVSPPLDNGEEARPKWFDYVMLGH